MKFQKIFNQLLPKRILAIKSNLKDSQKEIMGNLKILGIVSFQSNMKMNGTRKIPMIMITGIEINSTTFGASKASIGVIMYTISSFSYIILMSFINHLHS